MQSYRELIVWQKGIKLVADIYEITSKFPKEEIFGITSQMRRAALSIPSNIAEGYARKHREEYGQFIRIAFGSGAELETQLIVAKKLNLISEEKLRNIDALLCEIMKMLNKLSSTISQNN